jgi:hypothetical protein
VAEQQAEPAAVDVPRELPAVADVPPGQVQLAAVDVPRGQVQPVAEPVVVESPVAEPATGAATGVVSAVESEIEAAIGVVDRIAPEASVVAADWA